MSHDHEALEQARRRMIRYRVIAILDAGRPYPVGESMLLDVLTDADLAATQDDVRKALQYLCDKGFVEIEINERKVWESRLLPDGVDYLENKNIDEPGIARPSF